MIYKRTNDIWVYKEGKCYSGQIMVSYQNVSMTGGLIIRDYVVHRTVSDGVWSMSDANERHTNKKEGGNSRKV